MAKFLIEYPYAGMWYGEEIEAANQAEAEERLKAMSWGKVSGQLAARIDLPEGAQGKPPDIVMVFLMRLMATWMNFR